MINIKECIYRVKFLKTGLTSLTPSNIQLKGLKMKLPDVPLTSGREKSAKVPLKMQLFTCTTRTG